MPCNEVILLFHFLFVVSAIFLLSYLGKEGLGVGFVLFLLTCNLFITKEMEICGLGITVCDVYTVGSVLCLNLIQEIYGNKFSRRYLYIGVCALILFVLLAQFQLAYAPTPHSLKFSNAFDLLLSASLRIMGSSLLVILISDRVDMKFFSFLKKRFASSPFRSRFLLSTLTSQAIDTILFSFAGLYGIVENIWTVIIVAYITKVTFIVGSAVFFSFVKKEFFITRQIKDAEFLARPANIPIRSK